MGHLFCTPSNSAAEVGIYFFKVATSITSDTRGIHFLGPTSTARGTVSQLLSATASTHTPAAESGSFGVGNFLNLAFLKAVFVSD